ncbi:hypothetical protein RI129_001132 [Pyrocoelia pectoralis]|uniref:Protein kinase domain-containing protein n=1 Tax=Pyrocoelia pectoralis TaxID=417401 RepID=A0AAN7VUP3_9COLE
MAMHRFKLGPILKYGTFGGLAVGTFFSLRTNDYQVDSIGIVRLSRAAAAVFDITSVYRKKLYQSGLDKGSLEYNNLLSYCHKEAAEKLLQLCCTNKGVYIKVGQHIAALDYLVPEEYVQTMKILHSRAPSSTLQDVYKVLKEDLKRNPNEIFKSIELEPLGAASLAQVHKAVLHDGTTVAVKVQHAYVQGNSRVDMKTMESLVKIVSWLFPDFKFQWLVDETKKNLPKELNFEEEGKNAEKISESFRHYEWLKVPKIRWDLTTPRVLTMEYLEGGQVNDLNYIKDNGINPYEVTEKLGKLYSEMIFMNGFVHSDPHPGNILVRNSSNNGCEVLLLDHGLYATLSKEFRVSYANLWLSILNSDRAAMRMYSDKLGIHGDLYGLFACMVTGRSWDSIMQGIDKRQQTAQDMNKVKQALPRYLPQISGILENVNRQMLLILKTNDLIRGIEHTLHTHCRKAAFKVMSQYCVKSIYQDKLEISHSRFQKLKIKIIEKWLLFKINLYYVLLNLGNLYSIVINIGQKPLQVIES